MRKHSCTSIDEYIGLQPPTMRTYLADLRAVIKKAAPNAEEAISYGMPAFKYLGVLVYFAAWEKHVGFYPGGGGVITHFASRLKDYETSKGTVQLPPNEPLPVKLITDIIKYRVKQNEEKKRLKGK